jgi:hypothetical protein
MGSVDWWCYAHGSKYSISCTKTDIHKSQLGYWTSASAYRTPENSDNRNCSALERSGFYWEGMTPGVFSRYGDCSFIGFYAGNESTTARSILARQNDADPSMRCNGTFSISQYKLMVPVDMTIEFHYDVEDGSTCKHIASCLKGPNVVENIQCGCARQVSFQVTEGWKDFGLESIQFDCGASIGYSIMETSAIGSTTWAVSAAASVYSSSELGWLSSTPNTSEVFASSWSTNNESTPCTITPSKATSFANASHSAKMSQPAVSLGVPDVLPRCLNTWIDGCRDNTDKKCFCQDTTFTANVMDCIVSHGWDVAQIQQAKIYFLGICAGYISQNPPLAECAASLAIQDSASTLPPLKTPLLMLPWLNFSSLGITASTSDLLGTGGQPGHSESPTIEQSVPMTKIAVLQELTESICLPQTFAGFPSFRVTALTVIVESTILNVPNVDFTTSESSIGLVAVSLGTSDATTGPTATIARNLTPNTTLPSTDKSSSSSALQIANKAQIPQVPSRFRMLATLFVFFLALP